MARSRKAPDGATDRTNQGARSQRQSNAMSRQRRLAEKQAIEARARAFYYYLAAALLLAFMAFPTFVILAVGLAPTWVAMLVNNQRSADRVHCIGACNLAGVVPHLMTLWAGLHNLDHALHILSDVYTWAIMYLGAAAGVGALWLGPHLAASAHGLRIARRRRALEQYRMRLVEEWGGDIVPGAAPDESQDEKEKKNAA